MKKFLIILLTLVLVLASAFVVGCAPKVITIKFHLNDDAVSQATMGGKAEKEYTVGEKMLLPVPTREGYIFIGWKKDSMEGELLENGSTLRIEETFSAYAVWEYDENYSFALSYDLDGGKLNDGDENPSSYKHTDPEYTLKNPIKRGHKFLGWSEGNSATPVLEYKLSNQTWGSKNLKAIFKPIKYTIIFETSCMVEGVGEIKAEIINKKNPVEILADHALGDSMPKPQWGYSDVVVEEKYRNDYTFIRFYYENTKPENIIGSDTIFSIEKFGDEDREIVLKMLIGNMHGEPL